MRAYANTIVPVVLAYFAGACPSEAVGMALLLAALLATKFWRHL